LFTFAKHEKTQKSIGRKGREKPRTKRLKGGVEASNESEKWKTAIPCAKKSKRKNWFLSSVQVLGRWWRRDIRDRTIRSPDERKVKG
jgi:hypothetical protein